MRSMRLRTPAFPKGVSLIDTKLVFEGIKYSPKYVISLAHKQLTGEELSSGKFMR